MLSPAMRAATSAGDSMGNKLKSQFTGIEYSGRKMESSLDDLRKKLKGLEQIRAGTRIEEEFDRATKQMRSLNNEIKKIDSRGLEGKSGGGFGIGSLIKGNLMTMAITTGAGYVKDVVGAAVTGFSKQQQNITGLKTFLGEQGANEAYANIKIDAAATPFDTQSLLESNRALIAAGASAKDARTDTMNLANAIAAVGGGNDVLSRMSANMQQIKTVGKASAMDIRQFAMAGINIYQLLADETGKNVNQVKDMDVTYDLLSKSLAHAAQQGGLYFGAMDAQSKTLAGRWSTFKDNLGMAATEIGGKLEPLFSRLLELAVNVVNKFSDWIGYLQPVFDIINQIPDYINNIVNGSSNWSEYFDVIRSFAGSIWKTIKSLWDNIWSIVGGVVTWMQKSELLKDIFWAIGKVGEGLLATIRAIGDMIQWVWDNVIKPIVDAVDWVYSKIKGIFTGGDTTITVTDGTRKFTPDGVQNGPGAVVFQLPPDIKVAPKDTSKTGNLNIGGGGKDRADSINSGGQRSIVINIAKQIEKLDVHVMDTKEGVNEIEGMVREAMRRVMYSLNGVAV